MPKKQRGFTIKALSLFGVGALSLLGRLPFPILTRLGSHLGSLYYHIDGKRKRIGLDNLRLALGRGHSEEELNRLLKSVYKQMGKSLLEFAGIPRLNREQTERLVRFEGLDKIDAARKLGRGVILLTAHFGNWELLAQSAAIFGYPQYVLARPANVGLLKDYMIRCRERHGNKVILRDNAARKIFRLLKEGELLGLLGDQRGSTTHGLKIDFFGHPAPTDAALGRLLLKTQAPVLPAFIVRNYDNTHRAFINDPLKVRLTGQTEKDVRLLIEGYMKILEGYIEQYPDQWLWMHRRWMLDRKSAKT